MPHVVRPICLAMARLLNSTLFRARIWVFSSVHKHIARGMCKKNVEPTTCCLYVYQSSSLVSARIDMKCQKKNGVEEF
ncbi:hypothetical protein Y032_0432g1353 [Ancylostoma ceylanicum]|uniref:Uncharacterized protein n=1 Tax=Ancylostoma ceylanicum TaxID=53326 RepID=A0A016WZQ6_9BILA|nr:hypothetical protein Y032_0432g1353 [Ancylostoma ceylanicum]